MPGKYKRTRNWDHSVCQVSTSVPETEITLYVNTSVPETEITVYVSTSVPETEITVYVR